MSKSDNARTPGVAAAIEEAGGPGEPARPAEQLSLVGDAPAVPAPPRGPGRPAGAKNKRTQQWQKWMAATGEQPIEFLTRTFRKRTADLAEELDCDADAALRIQVDAAKAVLPYVDQKLPLAIETDDDDKARPVIIIGEMTVAQHAQAADRLGYKIIEHQQVTYDGNQLSDAEKSDDEAKPLSGNQFQCDGD